MRVTLPKPERGYKQVNEAQTRALIEKHLNDALTGAVSGDRIAAAIGVGANILPNTQFEIISDGAAVAALKEDGTGVMAAINCTANTVGAGEITASCADTTHIYNDRHYIFSAAADAALKDIVKRAYGKVANTSFKVFLSANKSTVGTSAFTVTLATRGTLGGYGNAQDGWLKTTTLLFRRNEWPAHIPAQAKYSGAFTKGAAGVEYTFATISQAQTKRLRGRLVTLTAKIKQQIKGGSGTARLFINAVTGGIGSLTYSAPLTKFNDFEALKVEATIGESVDYLDVGVAFEGASGDVYYLANPHFQQGYCEAGAYDQPINEEVYAVVKSTPANYWGASITFPTVVSSGTSYYSIPFELPQESDLVVAPGVRVVSIMQWELQSASAGVPFGFRNAESPPIAYNTFFNYTYVAGITSSVGGAAVLGSDNRGWFYTTTSGASVTLFSIDLNAYRLNTH